MKRYKAQLPIVDDKDSQWIIKEVYDADEVDAVLQFKDTRIRELIEMIIAREESTKRIIEQKERLHKTLEFYADEKNYFEDSEESYDGFRWKTVIEVDQGKRANKALKE